MKISQSLIDEMVAHAREDLPNECCGMIGGRDGEATSVVRVENAAASPLRYEMDPQGQYDALKAIEDGGRRAGRDLPLAHPQRRLSLADRRQRGADVARTGLRDRLAADEEAPDVKAYDLADLKIADVELDVA